MSFLAKAKKPEAKPPMITLVGLPGTGKTTLGALFPGAIVIQSEDGAAVFENWDDDAKPALMPRLPKATAERSTRTVLMQMVQELIDEDHDYRTLVVDSITTLDMLFGHEIALRDGVNTVADASGGFHKGFAEIAQWHAEFVYKCEQLRATKKMGIVFLAHSGIKKIRNRPDSASDYSVFSIGMDSQSSSVYTSQSDAVLYLRKDEFVQGAASNSKGQTTKFGRLIQSGDRKLVTTGDGHVGYIDAKNRYGMPSEIDVPHGENPIIPFIRFYNTEQ
jgi:hypothetical protein